MKVIEGSYSDVETGMNSRVFGLDLLRETMNNTVKIMTDKTPVKEQPQISVYPTQEKSYPNIYDQNPLLSQDYQSQPKNYDVYATQENVPVTPQNYESADVALSVTDRILVPEGPVSNNVSTNPKEDDIAAKTAAAMDLAAYSIDQRAYLDELQKAVN